MKPTFLESSKPKTTTSTPKTTIPKYKREQIDAQTRTEQLGDLQGKAEAQGQARIAQEQKKLAAQQGQRANLEMQSLNQKLTSFVNQADAVFSADAKDKAIKNVSQKLTKSQRAIMDIQDDPNMDMQTKAQKIAEQSVQLEDDFYSVYGKTYNNLAESSYVDQMAITALQSAKETARLSNGDPETFKESYKKYMDPVLNTAPSDSAKLMATRQFHRAGMATYQTLYNARYAEAKKEGKEYSNYAAEIFENEYLNAAERGDVPAAAESYASYKANREGAARSGHINPGAALVANSKLKVKGEQKRAMAMFNEALEVGQGLDVYTQAKQMYEDGGLDHWGAGVGRKTIDTMRTELEKSANLMADDMIKTYESGSTPYQEDKALMNDYYEVLSEAKQQSLLRAESTASVMAAVKGESPLEQRNIITQELAGKNLDRDERASLESALQVVNRNISASKTDPIQKGQDDGIYKLNILTPDTINPKFVADRVQHASQARTEYKTELKFFTKDEADNFAEYVQSKTVPIAKKVALIQQLPDHAFTQLNKKGATLFAAAGSVGNTRKAEDILRGGMYLKEGAAKIDGPALSDVVAGQIGNYFSYVGEGDTAKTMEGIKAYAANLAVKDGYSEEELVSDEYLESAVKAILGESGEFNDHRFFVPEGTDPDDVIDFIEDLKTANPIKDVPPGKEVDALNRSHILNTGNGEFIFIFDGVTLRNPDNTTYKLRVQL